MRMNSQQARHLVASGDLTADQAVDALLSGGPTWDSTMRCPECGAEFHCSAALPNGQLGRISTCSDACQARRNTAIMDLDGGRTIVRSSELTAERLGQLLDAAGLTVAARRVSAS